MSERSPKLVSSSQKPIRNKLQQNSDILIVGSGVAGALIGYELSKVGLRVTIVEAGSPVDRNHAVAQLKKSSVWLPETPYKILPHAEFPRTLNDTYIRQEGPDPFRSTYLRCLGGTTWHWLGTALRLLPSDFELKSRYGVGIDWPMCYSDLAPWYTLAEKSMGVSGHNDHDLGSPRDQPYPLAGLPPTFSDQLFAKGLRETVFRVRVSPQARNSEAYDGRVACCGSSSCIPICPVQAKYDATVHLKKAEKQGALILTNAVATRIEIGSENKVDNIVIRRPDISEQSMRAKHYVIAANAIEGPKLLLISKNDRYPNGVANSSDAVGRYLMDHPVQLTSALSPEPVWQRRGPLEVSSIHEQRDGNHREMHGAFLINIGNQGWEWPGPNLQALTKKYVQEGLSGTKLLNAIQAHASKEITLVALTEQLPNWSSRVQPDYERLDALGVPKPRIYYQLDQYSRKAFAAAKNLHQKLLNTLSASQIRHQGHANGAGHIMGTTRMGLDPKISVCKNTGQTHDHANLWLAGSSLFPTSGTANPTLTIAALALRTADELKKNLTH